jgi:hypothetical protein
MKEVITIMLPQYFLLAKSARIQEGLHRSQEKDVDTVGCHHILALPFEETALH